MIAMLIAPAILAAALQNNSADTARGALRTCIKTAVDEAKKAKVAADAFAPFAKQHCSTQMTSFKGAVWAFDAKNKVSKKQSESDSDLQIDDFVTTAADRYSMETSPQ